MKYARMGFSTQLFMSGGISGKLFVEMFSKLPPDSKILGFGNQDYKFPSYLFIGSDSFVDVSEVETPPDIYAVFKRDYNATTGETKDRCESIDFGLAMASPLTCLHVWKNYVGAMNTFDYCDKCGLKK